jgi:hypothetical protein
MQSFKRRRSQKGSELAKKLFCNGYLGLVIVLCALSTAFPVDETVRQMDGCKQTDKARELCLAWHHRATGLGASRDQLQPANEPSKPGEPGEPDHGHPEQSDRPDTSGRPDTQTRQTRQTRQNRQNRQNRRTDRQDRFRQI